MRIYFVYTNLNFELRRRRLLLHHYCDSSIRFCSLSPSFSLVDAVDIGQIYPPIMNEYIKPFFPWIFVVATTAAARAISLFFSFLFAVAQRLSKLTKVLFVRLFSLFKSTDAFVNGKILEKNSIELIFLCFLYVCCDSQLVNCTEWN